jgi:hypothetical protein
MSRFDQPHIFRAGPPSVRARTWSRGDFLAAVPPTPPSIGADAALGPMCFKCRKRDAHCLHSGMTEDETIVWRAGLPHRGRTSNWLVLDLSQVTPSN